MFKLYKNAFKTTNEGIILAIPLILFLWLLTLYINYSRFAVDTVPEMVLSVVTMLFMTSAFLAGWFYMVKKAVKFSKTDFIIENNVMKEAAKLIKSIPMGVGKFFLHFVGVSGIFLGLTLLMVGFLKLAASPFIVRINDVLVSFGISVSSPQEMSLILDKLPTDQILEMANAMLIPSIELMLIVILIPAIFSFLLLLWIPEIIYTHRNPLHALLGSIKKLFRNFGKSINLYIYITVIQMIISSIGAISLLNPIANAVSMFIYFYFLVYVVVLIFSYYDREFVETRKRNKS